MRTDNEFPSRKHPLGLGSRLARGATYRACLDGRGLEGGEGD